MSYETSTAALTGPHPFWTGIQRVADTAGHVKRFRRRYGGQDLPTRK